VPSTVAGRGQWDPVSRGRMEERDGSLVNTTGAGEVGGNPSQRGSGVRWAVASGAADLGCSTFGIGRNTRGHLKGVRKCHTDGQFGAGGSTSFKGEI